MTSAGRLAAAILRNAPKLARGLYVNSVKNIQADSVFKFPIRLAIPRFQRKTMAKPSNFFIYVRTGNLKYAGTNSNVSIVLYDEKGNCSDSISLDSFQYSGFERDSENKFTVPDRNLGAVNRYGQIVKVELWRDNAGLASAWYVDKVTVENVRTGCTFVFPMFRWVRPFYHYCIKEFDTFLPQFDQYHEQRQLELSEKQQSYQFTQNKPGLPVQIKKLPQSEKFSEEYQWDITTLKIKLLATKAVTTVLTGNWKSLGDLLGVYTGSFHVPKGANTWMDDVHFGLQRLCSQSHAVIELCRAIPDKLPVTDAMMKPLLEGLTLERAVARKRLFICDLQILEGLPVKPGMVLCVPIALFFLDGKQQLKPVAIQLFQKPGPENPIFLSSDNKLLWTLVKMWYNNADAAYHQSLTHLGFTHLLMEGIAITTHRQLSPSHPVFKLLAPHFLFLIAINTRGLQKLVCDNGWVDKCMNFGVDGMFELIRRGINMWRLDVHGTLPEDLKRRGLDDVSTLPNYHYRDDALLLYEAISKYVKAYVDLYYDAEYKLTGDTEIHTWVSELVKPRNFSRGGCGLLGVPGNGCLTSTDQLVTILVSIIFTCSVSHAASNFPQYEEYGFPPNYPGLLRGQPPKNKEPRTEQDIINALPSCSTTMDIMTVTKILSQMGTNGLGHFEVDYIFDPKAKQIVEEFRQDLSRIDHTIRERNKERHTPYEYLHPSTVPNSISI